MIFSTILLIAVTFFASSILIGFDNPEANQNIISVLQQKEVLCGGGCRRNSPPENDAT